MPLDLTPSGLAEASKCYCFTRDVAQRVKNYLWTVISGSTLTPAELAAAASCYCYDAKTAKAVLVSELCDQANDAGNSPLVTCTGAFLAAASKCWCFDHATAERVKIRLMVELANLSTLSPTELAAAAACYCMDHKTSMAIPLYTLCSPNEEPEPPEPPVPPSEKSTLVVVGAFRTGTTSFAVAAGVYATPNGTADPIVRGQLQMRWNGNPVYPAVWTDYWKNQSGYPYQEGGWYAANVASAISYADWNGRVIDVTYSNNESFSPGFPNSVSELYDMSLVQAWNHNPDLLYLDAASTAAINAIYPFLGTLSQPLGTGLWADSIFTTIPQTICWMGLIVQVIWNAGNSRALFVRRDNTYTPAGTYYYMAGTHIIDQITITI